MSPAQRAMCFAEWGPCWEALQRASGTTYADERSARLAIARKAIGREIQSWSELTKQKEIDWLLSVIWAISHGGDLNRQMRQVDQPLTRAEGSVFAQAYLGAIRDAAAVAGDQELAHRLGERSGRESYLNGISRRIHKRELVDLDDEQWRDVLAALNHTRQHKTGEHHKHPRSPWQGRGRAKKAVASHNLAGHVPATNAPSRTGGVTTPGHDEDPF